MLIKVLFFVQKKKILQLCIDVGDCFIGLVWWFCFWTNLVVDFGFSFFPLVRFVCVKNIVDMLMSSFLINLLSDYVSIGLSCFLVIIRSVISVF